jgi:hypothetical protein
LLCRYVFGTVDTAGAQTSVYTGSSIADFGSNLMLAEGNNTLYACVSDTDNARTCESTVVTVKKDDSFSLTDAVSKFDVGQLASTNDVGVLAAGASALQSMSAYAQQQAGDPASGGNDTSSSVADEAQKKKLQEEIDTKAGALINSLASYADNLVSDPQSMQQVGEIERVCCKQQHSCKGQVYNIPCMWQATCNSGCILQHVCWDRMSRQLTAAALTVTHIRVEALDAWHISHINGGINMSRTFNLFAVCIDHLLQVISAAAALSQTSSASSQETQSNLLSIAQAGLQSAQMSNKDISSDQISQIVSIAAVGTGTTKKTDTSSSSSKGSNKSKAGKRLLSVADTTATAVAKAAPPAAWLGGVRQILSAIPFGRPNRQLQEDNSTSGTDPVGSPDSSSSMPATIKGAAIQSVMNQAADLMLQQSTPATGLLSMGSQGLSVSATNLLGSTYAETPLAVGEALEAAAGSSSNKAASTTAPENVIVELSAPLLGVCEASDENSAPADSSAGCTDSTVSVVLQYYQDATLLLNTDVVAALEVASNDTNTTNGAGSSSNATANPLQDLQVVSGAVVLAVTGANADEYLPCLNTSSSSSSSSSGSSDNATTVPEGCGALLTLPITGGLDTNSSKELIVLRIDSSGVPVPDGLLLGVSNSSTATSSSQRLLADSATTAQVWTSKSGTFMMGQVTRAGGAPVVANDTGGSNQTAPDNTTACGNATLDANATGCNTTDVNTTITSNTTDLNTTYTSNTTSPESPLPGSNDTLPISTSPNNTVSSNATANDTAPGTNVTSNLTSPGSTTTTTTSGAANQTHQAAPSPSPSPTAQTSPSPSPPPSPQQQLGSGTAGPSDTTVALNLTFPMTFSELSSSQSLLNTFKADVAANIAKTLGIDATLVEVVDIREGSVKCDVIVTVPASYNTSQTAQLQTAVEQLVAAPDAGLADVKTKYNILQAVSAAVWEEPAAASATETALAAVTAQLAKLTKISTGKCQLCGCAASAASWLLSGHCAYCMLHGGTTAAVLAQHVTSNTATLHR